MDLLSGYAGHYYHTANLAKDNLIQYEPNTGEKFRIIQTSNNKYKLLSYNWKNFVIDQNCYRKYSGLDFVPSLTLNGVSTKCVNLAIDIDNILE